MSSPTLMDVTLSGAATGDWRPYVWGSGCRKANNRRAQPPRWSGLCELHRSETKQPSITATCGGLARRRSPRRPALLTAEAGTNPPPHRAPCSLSDGRPNRGWGGGFGGGLPAERFGGGRRARGGTHGGMECDGQECVTDKNGLFFLQRDTSLGNFSQFFKCFPRGKTNSLT